MVVVFQVLTLFALGIITVEVALFASISSGAWWLAAVGTVLAYVAFLAGIFLGDTDWVPRLFKAAYGRAFTSRFTGAVTALFSVAIALGGAWFVMDAWPRKELRVQVFSSSFLPQDRQSGVDVFVQHIQAPTPPRPKTTSAEGLAVFQVSVGDQLLVSVCMMRGGQLQFGAIPPRRIEKIPDYLPIKITDIPPDAWKGVATAVKRTDAVPPPRRISVASISERVPTIASQVTALSEADPKINAPWGLPQAPILLHRTGYSLGFDPTIKIPRWIAFRIQTTREFRRPQVPFARDPAIKPEDQAQPNEYRESGYDRGASFPQPTLMHWARKQHVRRSICLQLRRRHRN
jgi:hypothetical protein